MQTIADRRDEILHLERAMESAASGSGRVIFLSGDTGMGKSTLCDVAGEMAGERGFRVLKGWCFPEYMKPYLPLENALRPLGISHLFQATKPPRLERIFLISRAGILLASVGKENEEMDDDIFTGMLSAVGLFVKDSMGAMAGDDGSLDVLGYGGMRILMEKGEFCSMAAVIDGKENEHLIGDLKEALRRIEEEHGYEIKKSPMEEIEGAREILQSIIDSGKYEGVELVEDDPKLRMGNIMDNVSLAIQRKAKEGPLLMVIEDMQWSDASTISMMHYLARNIRESRVLIIGTYRPEEMGDRLREAINQMSMESLAELMEIGPIDERALRPFLKEMLRGIEGCDAIAEGIAGESGGNPLFATEMASMALENGGDFEIPDRVRTAIMDRVDRLPEEDREMAEAASVFQEFSLSVIATMLEKRKIAVIKSLKRMREMGIIEESAGTYRFRSPAIRDVLYREMGSDLAQAYHELAAEVLETAEERDPAALGYHYAMAGIPDKAVPNLTEAAEQAMRNYSNDEALRLLEQALSMAAGEMKKRVLSDMADVHMQTGSHAKALEYLKELVQEDGVERSDVMRRIAECMMHTGDYEGALETIGEAMSERADGRFLLVKGNIFYRTGNYDGAMEAYGLAMEYFRKEGMEKELAATTRAVGNIYFGKGDYQSAMEHYERALNTSEKDLSGKAMSLNNMGVVNVRTGNYEKAAGYFRQALRIRERIGDQWGVAMFLSNLGVVLSESGDYDGALEHFTRSLEIRRRIGDQWGVAMSLNNIGLIHLEKGDYADAIAHFEKAMNIRERIGDTDGMAASMNTMAMAYAEIGEIEKATKLYESALSIKEEIGDRDGLSEVLAGMGRTYGYAGDCDKAEEMLNRSISICRETENRKMLAYGLCALTEVMIECGKYRDDIMEELRPLAEDIGAREITAWYLRLKGILAGGEEGIGYLKESLDLFNEMGRKADVGKTLYWIGEIRGEKGEEDISAARRIFEECGMKNRLKKSRLSGGI